jgi:hypothetical protein
MTPRSPREDPTYYRFKYARIAGLLERKTEASRERRSEEAAPGDLPDQAAPVPHFAQSPAASQAIAAALRGLTPEQEAEGMDSRWLPVDAARLIFEASRQLRQLRWMWVGRRPAWYVRWWGWRHWRQRREYLLLGEFLNRVLEPAAVVLYFSCRLEEGSPVDIWNLPPPHGRLRRRWPEGQPASLAEIESWSAAYLSCILGRWYAEEDADAMDRRRVRSWPLIWLGNQGKRLLGRLGVTRFRPRQEIHYRVRYNLACLFSRFAAREKAAEILLSVAERQLQLSLEELHGTRRAALADRARRDPALEALRRASGYRFERIVPSPSRRSRT